MTDNAIAPQRHEERSESVREHNGEGNGVIAQSAAAAYSPFARPELAKSQNTADKTLPRGAVDEHGLSFGSVPEESISQAAPRPNTGADHRTSNGGNETAGNWTAHEVTPTDSRKDSKMPGEAARSLTYGAELPGSKSDRDVTKTAPEASKPEALKPEGMKPEAVKIESAKLTAAGGDHQGVQKKADDDPRHTAAAAETTELIDDNGIRQVPVKTFTEDRIREYEHAGMTNDDAVDKYNKEYNAFW